MRHMPDELREALWEKVLRHVDELKELNEHRGSSRSQALINADGYEVSCILDLGMADGSHKVFHVHARSHGFGGLNKVTVRVDRYFHNADAFWENQLTDRTDAVVIGGEHYRIGNGNGQWKGFGGRRHHIRFLDGREVTTCDLWYQGVIPPAFRDRLPDDAVFVEAVPS